MFLLRIVDNQTFSLTLSDVYKLGTAVSSSEAVSVGIPHSGILGPLLFIIYKKDLLKLNFCATAFGYAVTCPSSDQLKM